MSDATAVVTPADGQAATEQTPADNAAAVEQMQHAATCGICLTVVHALFAVAWRGGSPGYRAGEMADRIGRHFCAADRAADLAGEKASPEALAAAAGAAIDSYLQTYGAHVPDHQAFRQTIAQTIAAALGAAGEVVIAGASSDTRH